MSDERLRGRLARPCCRGGAEGHDPLCPRSGETVGEQRLRMAEDQPTNAMILNLLNEVKT